MLLKSRFSSSYNGIMKMIKRDLFRNFGEKGIQISDINVVLGKDKLKLKMSIKEWEISIFKGSFWMLPLNIEIFFSINANTPWSVLEYVLVRLCL